MPFWRFTVLTLAGCIPWVLMLGYIGQEVGARWEEWRDYLHYGDYVVIAAILGGHRLPADPASSRARAGGAGGTLTAPLGDAGATADAPGLEPRQGRGARCRPGADRAAPGLQLGPPLADPLARRLAGARARPRGAKELRGRASRRNRRRAADRPAAPDRRRAALLRRAPRGGDRRSRSFPPRSPATRSSARSRAVSVARGQSPPAWSRARSRWLLADRRPRSAAVATRPPGDGLALGIAPGRRRCGPGCRATVAPWRPLGDGASIASTPTSSRAPSPCR